MFLKRTIKILQDLDENRESFKGTKLKLEEISNKIFTQELIVNNFLSESNSHQKGLCIAVCVLFFEKVEQTIECIKSFLASGVNIYILNNGSSDKSRKTLGKFCGRYKQIKIFDSGKNLGVAVGRNYLITYTEEEWLLFIDNDIRIKTRNWLEKFREQISLHKDTEVFIPKLYNKRTRRYASKKFIEIEDNKAVINTEIQGEFSNCFPGGASFVNRKLFDRLGLYDKKMFIGLEDYELSIRGILQEKPIKAKIIEDIVLIHDHRLANKKEDRDAVNIRYNIDFTRNSINRIRKKHNILLVGDWISWCSKAQNRLLHNQKQSLKMRLTKLIPYKVRKIVKNFLKNSNNNLLF